MLAGATPAAIGLLADMTEAYPERPRRDHGPVLGVPGDRPDHRRLVGGAAAECRGLDGIFVVAFLFLAIALVPLASSAGYEHLFGAGPAASRAD